MIYADYIKQGGKGIITLLSENQTLNYLLSDAIKPLDDSFLLENGTKKFAMPVENILTTQNDLTPVANMLKVRYGLYWQVLYNSQPNEADPIYSVVTVGNAELTTKGNTVNQVSGYDSPAMIDSDGVNTSGTQKNTNSMKTLNYTDLTKLLGELKNNVFYDKLFTDIKNYVFSTLYGNERE